MDETLSKRGQIFCCRHIHNYSNSQAITKQVADNFDSGIEIGQGEATLHLLDHNQFPETNLLKSTINDYKVMCKDKLTSQTVQTDPVTFLDTSFFKDLINNNNFTNASVQATEDSSKQCSYFWRYFCYSIQAALILLFMSHYHTCVLSFCEHVGRSGLVTTVAEYITPTRRIEKESFQNKIMNSLADLRDVIVDLLQRVLH